ncbi:HDOD domain-containing protein [Rhodoferax aquaticus]|uniref:HDOD domain-containing protein n=1 Tax=Rhodoferax aquaticus TaxID=2527691 RepID=A0A515EPP8_9BURK|nr:HDOD domain-containing protein [Rhodoferax aquaticus]QDL54637.1 HDOD domain-containing protein [Rhodoferax aquaticus]
MTLSELLENEFNLPSIPRVVALLLSELGRVDVDLHKITQLISTDPALTCRILCMANANSFQLQGRIHSVSEALALLNLSHVYGMAQEAASGASLKAVPGLQLQHFWNYSLDVAKIARALAGLVRQNQQAAFTCGLVHAIGEIAMHVGLPEEVGRLNQTVSPLDMRRAKAERRELGFCFASAGAGLARKWQFPESMVDALEHQYAPFENAVYEPLAGVIHLASWRARGKEAQLGQRELAVTFPGPVGEALQLDIDMVLQQDPFDWGVDW